MLGLPLPQRPPEIVLVLVLPGRWRQRVPLPIPATIFWVSSTGLTPLPEHVCGIGTSTSIEALPQPSPMAHEMAGSAMCTSAAVLLCTGAVLCSTSSLVCQLLALLCTCRGDHMQLGRAKTGAHQCVANTCGASSIGSPLVSG